MRRPLKITLLLALIALIGAFDLFRIEFRGPKNNYFNQALRYRFARSEFGRKFFQLKDYGDNRADYLGSRYSKIELFVDVTPGLDLNQDVLKQLAAKIQAVTGKPTFFTVSDYLPAAAEVDDRDIGILYSAHTKMQIPPDTAPLYLFVLSRESGQPDLIGKTYFADSLVIFDSAISSFTASEPETFESYQLSTALHEFGHQLGLEHNNIPGCLMNAKAENSGVPAADPGEVVTDFCAAELSQIKQLPY